MKKTLTTAIAVLAGISAQENAAHRLVAAGLVGLHAHHPHGRVPVRDRAEAA